MAVKKEAKVAKEPKEAKVAKEQEAVKEPIEEERPRRSFASDNMVFVGKKDTMAYVLAAVTQFNAGAKEVTIKARGRAISRAVDVAEIIRNRSVEGAKLVSIEISTEEVQTMDGRPLKVSAVEIKIKK
jgi:DNA-binding protein Alba